jgi:putative PIN family toxin of toxin-antitoxin system
MIFLQGAARRESAAGACLLLAELAAIELCVSEEIMGEVRDVLARPKVRVKFPALTDQIVGRFLAALEDRAALIPDVPRVFQFGRDSKDEPYINLAIAARADYLVSRGAAGDPSTYGAMAAVLVVAAVLASYLPARRASTVDPVETLRAE